MQTYSCIIAASLLRDAGKICMRMGSQTVSMDFSIPVTILIVMFNCMWTSFICMLTAHTGAQHSSTEETRANVVVHKVWVSAHNWSQLICGLYYSLTFILVAFFIRCWLQSNLPKIFWEILMPTSLKSNPGLNQEKVPAITTHIKTSYCGGLKTIAACVDLSLAYDTVWQNGLLLKVLKIVRCRTSLFLPTVMLTNFMFCVHLTDQ